MALGDANVNQNRTYSPNYYSKWSIKQKDSKLKLSASYGSGLLKISVLQQGEGYRYDPLADISLSPVKARIFADQMQQFIDDFFSEDGWSGKSYGVDTGFKDVRPVIIATVINGSPYIVIGKVNPDGSFESRVDYSINQEYHYGLVWSDLDNMSVDRSFYNCTELEQIRDLCLEYAASAFGSTAASTLEMMKWDYSIGRNVEAIADKLGVERRGRSDSSTGNSFFNKDHNPDAGSNSTPARTSRVSMDDLDID